MTARVASPSGAHARPTLESSIVPQNLRIPGPTTLPASVREAGGRFTSLDGTDGPWGGNALATNAHLHEAALSVHVAVAEMFLPRAGHQPGSLLSSRLAVFGMDQLEDRPPQHVLASIPQHAFERRADVEQRAIGSHHADHVR